MVFQLDSVRSGRCLLSSGLHQGPRLRAAGLWTWGSATCAGTNPPAQARRGWFSGSGWDLRSCAPDQWVWSPVAGWRPGREGANPQPRGARACIGPDASWLLKAREQGPTGGLTFWKLSGVDAATCEAQSLAGEKVPGVGVGGAPTPRGWRRDFALRHRVLPRVSPGSVPAAPRRPSSSLWLLRGPLHCPAPGIKLPPWERSAHPPRASPRCRLQPSQPPSRCPYPAAVDFIE